MSTTVIPRRMEQGGYRFTDVARMEWIKLRTLRSTGWITLILAAGMLGLAVLVISQAKYAKLSAADLTPTVMSTAGAPYAFHGKLTELASMFSSKELAVVANVGSLVQPLTRAQYQSAQAAIPLNLFSHSDQQLAWQTSIAQGHSPTGWAGRAAVVRHDREFQAVHAVRGRPALGLLQQAAADAPAARRGDHADHQVGRAAGAAE